MGAGPVRGQREGLHFAFMGTTSWWGNYPLGAPWWPPSLPAALGKEGTPEKVTGEFVLHGNLTCV